MLLRMLNMSHVSGTLIGDEFVRGVSGGERKRVSIAEMMSTIAPLQSLLGGWMHRRPLTA